MFKFLQPQKSLEDIKLIAWHHMINDTFLTTYEFMNGHEYRAYVNPKLAYKRALTEMANEFSYVADALLKKFLPSFEDMSKAFQNFAKYLDQYDLKPLLPDGDVLG